MLATNSKIIENSKVVTEVPDEHIRIANILWINSNLLHWGQKEDRQLFHARIEFEKKQVVGKTKSNLVGLNAMKA